jgi:predicted DNA-binding transcriptional regulator AlpA
MTTPVNIPLENSALVLPISLHSRLPKTLHCCLPATTPALLIDKAEGRRLDMDQGLIDIKALAYFTSMSERLIFNLMKDSAFPRLKIGRKVLFEKKTVMDYLVRKYGNWG